MTKTTVRNALVESWPPRHRQGRTVRRFLAAMTLLLAMTGFGVGTGSGVVADESAPAVGQAAPAFTPGTDPDIIERVLTERTLQRSGAAQFSEHWNPSATALGTGGASQGDSLDLTWSIVPDGTVIASNPQFDSDGRGCASDLIATMDALYGAGVWRAQIQAVFDDWSSHSGNVYTPAVAVDGDGAPIDDGAAFPTAPGVAGVRGDLRIGGCEIGPNAAAYAYYPGSGGDMKLDTAEFVSDASSVSKKFTLNIFHNLVSHEHGHNLGLDHVCPKDESKLMETEVTGAFWGLQIDDIRGAQRGYGDRLETPGSSNDTGADATPLDLEPTVAEPPDIVKTVEEKQLSLDSTSDTDWFKVSARAGNTIDVSVTPFIQVNTNDLRYMVGSCSGETSMLDSMAVQDLKFEIRDSNGVLTTVDAADAGSPESIEDFRLDVTGDHYIRVFGTGTDDTQLYDISVTKKPGIAPTQDFGDAPAPYPTLLSADGARHDAVGSVLGSLFDSEFDGFPSADALGDDDIEVADEDGVTFTGPVAAGTEATVEVTATVLPVSGEPFAAVLDAWIDFDADGDWDDPGERIFDGTVLRYGANPLSFPVPADAAGGQTYARFRVSNSGVSAPTGSATSGEVQDYRLAIVGRPSAPTGVTAVAGDGQAAVSWTAPSTGGSPITGYTVSSNPGGATCSTTGALSCVVTALNNGTPYTFTVVAANARGTGPASVASNAVTPTVPSAIVSTAPQRFVDTRPDGETLDDDFEKLGRLETGSELRVQIAGRGTVPAGARAVVANLTAIRADGVGFVTAHPCTTPRPLASSLNFTGGVNLGNEIIVPLSDSGEICLYTSRGAHLTVDVVGHVSAASPVVPVTPARFLDTRPEGETIDDAFVGGVKPGPGGTEVLGVGGRGQIPSDAVAVIVNVTAIQAEGVGYVTVHPCLASPPNAASLNFVAGVNRGNELVAELDDVGKICLYTSTGTHLSADVVGYLPAGTDLTPFGPARLLDTRLDGETFDGESRGEGRRPADSEYRLDIAGRGGIPADARAAVLNITGIQAERSGYLTVHPCLGTRPNTASLNYVSGVNGGNEIIAQLDDEGAVCIYTSSPLHLTVDIVAHVT